MIDEVYGVENGVVMVEEKFMRAPRKTISGSYLSAAACAMLAEEKIGKIARKIVIR